MVKNVTHIPKVSSLDSLNLEALNKTIETYSTSNQTNKTEDQETETSYGYSTSGISSQTEDTEQVQWVPMTEDSMEWVPMGPPPEMSAMIDELSETNPELATALKSMAALSPEERKAKMDELMTEYPDELKNFAPPMRPMGPPPDMGMDEDQSNSDEFGNVSSTTSSRRHMRPMGPPPDMNSLLETLKETNPDLAAQLEALQNLTPEERKTKMDELIAKYPDELKNFVPPMRPMGPPPDMENMDGFQGNEEEAGSVSSTTSSTRRMRPMGPPPEITQMIESLKETNPELAAELEALESLTPEQRKVKMDELLAKYPEEFKNFATPMRPMGPPPDMGNIDEDQSYGDYEDYSSTSSTGTIEDLLQSIRINNPDLFAELESLADLDPEEQQVKIEALMTQYYEELKRSRDKNHDQKVQETLN